MTGKDGTIARAVKEVVGEAVKPVDIFLFLTEPDFYAAIPVLSRFFAIDILKLGGLSLCRIGERKDEAFQASRPRGLLLADFSPRIEVYLVPRNCGTHLSVAVLCA